MQDAKNGKPRAMRLMLGSVPWLKELSLGGNGEFRLMEALGLHLSEALSRGGRVLLNTHSFIIFDRVWVGIQERVPAAACCEL